MNQFYLVDLERSNASGEIHYWKGNRHGYTPNVKEAGLFSEESAKETVESDFDKNTVMIRKDEVDQIDLNTISQD